MNNTCSKSFCRGVATILLLGILTGCSGEASNTTSGAGNIIPVPGSGTITKGSETVVTKASVSQTGGIVTVTGSLMNGLALAVPSGSYADSRSFTISIAPVANHTFGEMFNPISPIITVENGGGYSEEIMTVKIPVKVPVGHFAMGFIYNMNTNTLEGMPTIDQDATSITVATRHFSATEQTAGKITTKGVAASTSVAKDLSIIISSIDEKLLNKDIDTHFRPGIDDWQFSNYGSFIASGGHCTGQSMAAMWYFYEHPDGADRTLYGRYDNNGNLPPTPELWEDDSLGYRFASVVWKEMDWGSLSRKITEKYVAKNDTNTWRLFAYSMLMTGQPQMTEIWNSPLGGGHAMVVYRIFNGHLYIADPNYPANTERRIEYANGRFTPYNSGENSEEIAKGNGKVYDGITYVAKTALSDWSKIGARWAEVKNNTIGNDLFPTYTIERKDEDGSWKILSDGFVATNKLINIYINSAADGAVRVTREGVRVYRDANGTYELTPGINKLGIYFSGLLVDASGNPVLDSNNSKRYRYIDFTYVTVIYTPPPEIRLVSPDSGISGTSVTITGTGFGVANGTVLFNGGASASILSWSDTLIVASVPTGTVAGNIVVTNRVTGAASNGVPFTVPVGDNGTVTIGNLTWVKNANCFGILRWQDAAAKIADLADGQCGLSDGSRAGDWRFPTVAELSTFVGAGYPPAGFTNFQYAWYWSSTIYVYMTYGAWGMADGVVGTGYIASGCYTWPVRARTQ
jgi:hypothetical protein